MLAPVPLSETVFGPFVASLTMEAVALKVPAALGVNTTLTGKLCPAATVTGRLGALNAKYLVENDTLLTVTDTVPVLETVKLTVLLVPAVTVPKSRLATLADSVPEAWVEDDLELNPWQPTIVAMQRRRIPSLLALMLVTVVSIWKLVIGLSHKAAVRNLRNLTLPVWA